MGGGTYSPWLILLLLPLVWAEIRPNDCVRFEEITSIRNAFKNMWQPEKLDYCWELPSWQRLNRVGCERRRRSKHSGWFPIPLFISLAFFQGFATKFSVVKGDIVQFKIKTDSSNYRLDIFRVGWFADDRFPITTRITITFEIKIRTKITITIITL